MARQVWVNDYFEMKDLYSPVIRASTEGRKHESLVIFQTCPVMQTTRGLKNTVTTADRKSIYGYKQQLKRN